MKLQADVVESFLAALTLDKGLCAAERFLDEHLFPNLLVGRSSALSVVGQYSAVGSNFPMGGGGGGL